MEELIQLVANGLVTGAIIAMGAVGISLVYSILRIVNFAHGDYLTFGAYMALVANSTWRLPLVLSVIFALVTTAVLGQVVELTLWKPMRKRGARVLRLFIVSAGVALVLRNAISLVWGNEFRRYRGIDPFQVYNFGFLKLSLSQVVVIAITFLTLVLAGILLARTRLGKSMRAVSNNPDLASVAGVNVESVTAFTWLSGSAMAGMAGVLQALIQSPFNPNLGFLLLLPMFAAVVLGGIGNAYGTLAGGMILGITMEVSTWSALAGGASSVYKPVVAFTVLILVLLFRPDGIFGKARVL
jgi:branched-subunit amino acid ABC-type transport system permease component